MSVPDAETMDGTSLRRPDGSNYEIVGQEYPADEMVECVGVGTYANVYVLGERHRHGAREYARLYTCSNKDANIDPGEGRAVYIPICALKRQLSGTRGGSTAVCIPVCA